jgi:putative PIN family toxin of toxin-antitoxin system
MNVVLDTNIIVSAALSPNGNCAKIIEIVSTQEEMQLYYGYEILFEYITVLSRPKLKIALEVQFAIIESIKDVGKIINPPLSDFQLTDESDRIFYDTAKASESVLITGNIKHFPSESFIMTASDFLSKYNR